ncbi:serine hydrolase [Afipia sp. P52-10]|uniref:serine hydrolase domain-containing protein n=1 Tax=Afipia sp. P52-10 TaxID=1429916 RepID=UPI0004AFDE91|nr:serine hydrolase domain-containing protein [Afipia sp. P52-10]
MITASATVVSGDLAECHSTGDHDSDRDVPWWSFTKTLIAAAALVLVRDGRLQLDTHMPGRRFTLRQLLQNRAGVPNYGGLAAYHRDVAANRDPWPVAELLRAVDADQLRFSPGEGWEYSNVGYLLVRQAIEEACGSDLDHALKRLVFAPLGIAGARVALARADLADVAMGEAASYHPGWVYHGLAVGPIGDAASILDRLLTGDLLPAPLLAAMCDAHPLGGPVEGRPWQTAGYGLGLMIGTGRVGQRVLGHTGGGPGSVIAVYRCPARNRTIAAFSPSADENAVESFAFAD